MPAPVLFAPVGVQTLAHPDGEAGERFVFTVDRAKTDQSGYGHERGGPE